MRIIHVGYILLLTLNIAFAQTYIVKFSSQSPDTARFSERFRSISSSGAFRASRTVSHTLRSFRHDIPRSTSSFPWDQYAVLRVSVPLSDNALQQLASDPSISSIEPQRQYSVYSTPNDSAFSSQWNLRRIGVDQLYRDGTIGPSLPSVKVAFIDTGIDEAHPDLNAAIAVNTGEYGSGKESNGVDDDNNGYVDDWRGFDFVDLSSEDAGDWSERDNDPADENGHGTAVAGIIGAIAHNSIGLAGIAPAKLMPLRAFGKNGTGNDIDIAAAIIYAAENGASVINMSFGDVVRSSLIHDAIRFAYHWNVILVASSGNVGSAAPHYPSDHDEVISVGSIGATNARSFFSSYGPSLDVTAPGEQIVTTTMGGGYTDAFSGTSAAAPHVAAVAALMSSSEMKKAAATPGYVRYSNEEIRGILLQTADDIGTTGWDAHTGAGVVNALGAVRALAGSEVRIHAPALDQIVSTDSLSVTITAAGPYMTSLTLSIGAGENPTQWKELYNNSNRFYTNETLPSFPRTDLLDGIYLLRLAVHNSIGSNQEFRQRIILDRTAPRIVSFRYRDSVIVEDRYGMLIEARTDRNTTGRLFVRRKGTTSFAEIRSQGVQMNHYFVITSKDIPPLIEHDFFCEFSEAGKNGRIVRFPTTAAAGTEHFAVTVNDRPIQSSGFVQHPFNLPPSYLLGSVRTVNSMPTVIVNQYTADDEFGPLKAFQFNVAGFVLRDSTQRSWIPRSLETETATKLTAVLVQDHGVSRLFRVDTTSNTFFQQTLWSDSSDVWASAFTDLNGDGVNEIIARSSSEFLIYQKQGNGTYTVVSRLPNPSPPLSGEARNQFGPPRSITGDFTGSGRKEIIVADYDGDLLLYRQTSPNAVTFELSAIDTSDLFGMSEYLTTGDFNGDGITEVVAAGHANPDWNGDREYDAPVWTVRVFGRIASDPSGILPLVWTHSFVGVKAGSGYDNGVTSGKLRTSDGSDALFLSLNPFLYVFRWNSTARSFESVWHHASLSNTVLVSDLDGDGNSDIGFRTRTATEFWSLENAGAVMAPFGVTASSVSASSVRIAWRSSATSHKLYRGVHKDSLSLLVLLGSVPSYLDTVVISGRRYYYAVTAVGAGESGRSMTVSSVPHSAPVITSIHQASGFQLLMSLSSDLDPDDVAAMSFSADSAVTSSNVLWVSARRLLVSFPTPFAAGAHSIRIRSLKDAEGMEADTSIIFPFTAVTEEPELFTLRSAIRSSGTTVLLDFNQPVDPISALVPANFHVRTAIRQYPIRSVDSISPTSVRLRLTDDISLIASRIEIQVSAAVLSGNGVPLNLGKGVLRSIDQETASLDRIVVFPNPVRSQVNVSFVNIPVNCRITIFAATGERIATLSNRTGTEGVSWNLRAQDGNLVSTGIYLYRVEQLNDSDALVGTTMGKFAVIR